VNASASSLDREVEVQSKIGKVRTFGRIARVPCAAIFGFGVVGCVIMFISAAIGATVQGGPFDNNGWTPQMRIWALPVAGVAFSLWLGVVYQFYRLFGNLAGGAIYTPENVRRVRNVGLLWLLWAVLSVLIPVAWAALYAFVFIAPSPSKPADWFSLSETLGSFIYAGLILLVSWIMDVGLYEKDHAEALKRDADLVI
jgi:hypothetical protein